MHHTIMTGPSVFDCCSRGLILQDLTFVHLGNPDSLVTPQGSKVNFSKQWQQFNILATLRSYQQVSVLAILQSCSTTFLQYYNESDCVYN